MPIRAQRMGTYRRTPIVLAVDKANAARLRRLARIYLLDVTALWPAALLGYAVAIVLSLRWLTGHILPPLWQLTAVMTVALVAVITSLLTPLLKRIAAVPQYPQIDGHGDILIKNVHPVAARQWIDANPPGTIQVTGARPSAAPGSGGGGG